MRSDPDHDVCREREFNLQEQIRYLKGQITYLQEELASTEDELNKAVEKLNRYDDADGA